MDILDWMNPLNKVLDIVDQAVPDKDKAAEIKGHLDELRQQVYMKELDTKTIPWVDATHKMGRQIMALAQLGFYAWALHAGVEITPELVGGVSGTAAIYTAMKGKGR